MCYCGLGFGNSNASYKLIIKKAQVPFGTLSPVWCLNLNFILLSCNRTKFSALTISLYISKYFNITPSAGCMILSLTLMLLFPGIFFISLSKSLFLFENSNTNNCFYSEPPVFLVIPKIADTRKDVNNFKKKFGGENFCLILAE